MLLKRRCFKITCSDWYPAYKMDGYHNGNKNPRLVEVSLLSLRDGKTRVCVWGADDYGYEKDFETAKKAKSVFNLILDLPSVNVPYLEDLGFIRA